MTQHDGFRFQTAHADGDNAQCVNVWGVGVGAHAGIRERHAFTRLNHWRHFLQVDLVHDAVARRNYVHVFERGFGPLDEVETVFVAAVFNGAVFFKGFWVETGRFHSQRVVND